MKNKSCIIRNLIHTSYVFYVPNKNLHYLLQTIHMVYTQNKHHFSYQLLHTYVFQHICNKVHNNKKNSIYINKRIVSFFLISSEYHLITLYARNSYQMF